MTQQRVDQHHISSLRKTRNPVMFPSSPSIFGRPPPELHTSFSISSVHTFLNFLRFCLAIPLKNSCKNFKSSNLPLLFGESQVLGEIEQNPPRPSAPRPEGLAGRYSSPPPGASKKHRSEMLESVESL